MDGVGGNENEVFRDSIPDQSLCRKAQRQRNCVEKRTSCTQLSKEERSSASSPKAEREEKERSSEDASAAST